MIELQQNVPTKSINSDEGIEKVEETKPEKQFSFPKLEATLKIDPQLIDDFVNRIYIELCDDLIFSLALQIHRASKLGYLYYIQPDQTDDSKFQIYEKNDVIGVFSSLNSECVFPNKGQSIFSFCYLNFTYVKLYNLFSLQIETQLVRAIVLTQIRITTTIHIALLTNLSAFVRVAIEMYDNY